MSYEVKIIADSVSPCGVRLTTFQLKYPRLVHSALMSHRAFSRNASSSRAIPLEKMVEWVESDPVVPVHWGGKRKGMQAGEEVPPDRKTLARLCWLGGFKALVGFVKVLGVLGVHKQLCNRLIEPWSYINTIVTATDFDNFFCLRCHRDAQPELQKLAVMMAREYYFASAPSHLPEGAWHLPYVGAERHFYPEEKLVKMAVARCCRVSYLTVEGRPADPEKDLALHDQLLADRHMSPFEHVARAEATPSPSGNFRGWTQYRKTIPGEVYEKFDPKTLEQFEKDYVV